MSRWRSVSLPSASASSFFLDGVISFEVSEPEVICTKSSENEKCFGPIHSKKTKAKAKAKIKTKIHKTQAHKSASIQKESEDQHNNKEEQFAEKQSAWDVFSLHHTLKGALHNAGFIKPTEIQEKVIPNVINGWKDVIGIAETGSGKTLAFCIPIMQRWIEMSENGKRAQGLFALIITPTRELAIQIKNHFQQVAHVTQIQSMTMVGGMSEAKQLRVLGKKPDVVIATPGRLWDVIQQGNEHLCNLMTLRFFVLDEADRMIASGHFPELSNILSFVEKQRRGELTGNIFAMDAADERTSELIVKKNDEDATVNVENSNVAKSHDNESDEIDSDADMDVALNTVAKQRSMSKISRKKSIVKNSEQFLITDTGEIVDVSAASKKKRACRCQIMLFSATLSLPTEGRQSTRSARTQNTARLSMLDELQKQLHFEKPPLIIDISNLTVQTLHESSVECATDDKDYYLYYYLLQNRGKTIIFCNAISAVRRLSALLQHLLLPVMPLHASMQQRQRLKYLDRFKSTPDALLICTDIAARGVDIPDVQYVIHYQLPRNTEIYVHRVGRTARAGREGWSFALVSEGDLKTYNHLCTVLGHKIESIHVQQDLMRSIRERMSLAHTIDGLQNTTNKQRVDDDWLRKHADAMDIELDDEFHGKALKRQRRAALTDPDDDDSATKSNGKSAKRQKQHGIVNVNPQNTKRQLIVLKAQLKQLLSASLTKRQTKAKYFTLNSDIDAALQEAAI